MPAYEDAIRAYMAGHKTEAQTLLGKALRANPRDQASWLLLAQCVDVVERKKYCLQQVLLINPKNPEALERLAELQKRPTPPFQTAALQAELNSDASKEAAPAVSSPASASPESALDSETEPLSQPSMSEAPDSTAETTSEPEVFAAPESTSAPMAAEPVVEESQRPITRSFMSALSSEPFAEKPKKTSTRPLLPSLTIDEPVTEEESKKPSTRPFAIPLETTDEPKRPITRPLAAPPEPPAEPKKPATQPLPPPPPALQEILDARASGGANDETLITSNKAASDFQPLDADEAFAPLPDSQPPVSGFGAIIMDDDDASFRPGPFSEAEQEPAEADSFESPSAEPDPDLQDPIPDPEPESALSETDDVTLVGAPAPVSEFTPGVVPPPVPTKPGFRARLEEAVAVLEKGDKPEGVRLLESLLHDNPRNEMAWMWLGAASYDVNRQRECYLRALEVNPRSRMARLKLAEAEDRLTAAGVALHPLDHPLPPDPTLPEAPAPTSSATVWIGVGLVIVALILVIGFVVYWVVTHR